MSKMGREFLKRFPNGNEGEAYRQGYYDGKEECSRRRNMDTSETYIKMCEKAEEIQEARYGLDLYGDNSFFAYVVCPHGKVWLPRQDQLQEMVMGKHEHPALLLQAFYDFCVLLSEKDTQDQVWDDIEEIHPDGLVVYKSMEQLWLAFVMKEKYNKVWDGEDW